VAVEIVRLLPAEPAVVFDWWTDAAHIQQWMTPTGTVEAEVSAKVGGTFRIVMRGEGVELVHAGEYLEVDRPHRLVFTWRSPYAGDGSVVTVEFEPAAQGSTRLRLLHTGLPEGFEPSHGSGWGTMVDKLSARLTSSR